MTKTSAGSHVRLFRLIAPALFFGLVFASMWSIGTAQAASVNCSDRSNIFDPSCATTTYQPLDMQNAAQYLQPSLGQGTPTCRATTLAEFRKCVTGTIPAGTIVEVSDQNWDAIGSVDIIASGTPAAPVTIRTQHVGGVVITGSSSFMAKGTWVRIEGFTFAGAYSGIDRSTAIAIGYGTDKWCTHCLIDNVTLAGYDHADLSDLVPFLVWGQWNRVAYNAFSGKLAIGTFLAVNCDYREPPDYTLIDHNYFSNQLKSIYGVNGHEAIVIGNDWSVGQTPPYADYRVSNAVITDNLFYHFNGPMKMIDLKSSGVVIRNNTFIEASNAAINARTADTAIVEGNVFLGDDTPMTGGVQMWGDGHVVINNLFEHLSASDGTTTQPWARPIIMYTGDPLWRNYVWLFKPPTNITIAFNVFAHNDSGWMAGSPAVNTSSGLIQEPSNIRFIGNAISGSASYAILSRSASSTVTTSGNLCDGSVTETTCASGVTFTQASNGLSEPTDATNPTRIASRSAYAALDLSPETLSKLYYINLYPGQPIPYKILTVSDVGPQAWPSITATSTATAGTAIAVSWSGLSNPDIHTWIGFYRSGDPFNHTSAGATSYTWVYLNTCAQKLGTTTPLVSGSCSIRIPAGQAAGNYVFELFGDDTFAKPLAQSSMSVSAGSSVLSITATSSALAGTGVAVSWNGLSNPDIHTWIGFYRSGDAFNQANAGATSYTWAYLNTCSKTLGTSIPAVSSSCAITIPALQAPGNYVFELFGDDTYAQPLAQSSVLVSAPKVAPGVTVTYPNGTELIHRDGSHFITWTTTGSPGNGNIYLVSSQGSECKLGSFSAGAKSLAVRFDAASPCAPIVGQQYKIELYASDGLGDGKDVSDVSDASFTFTDAGPALQTSVGESAGGTSVTVSWSDIASPTAGNWIALFKQGATTYNDAALSTGGYAWFWTDACSKNQGTVGVSAGSCPFTIPSSLMRGSYYFELFGDSTYNKPLLSAPVNVL